jgi:hypothetical protein
MGDGDPYFVKPTSHKPDAAFEYLLDCSAFTEILVRLYSIPQSRHPNAPPIFSLTVCNKRHDFEELGADPTHRPSPCR